MFWFTKKNIFIIIILGEEYMSKIKVMDEILANKIAAGEVVERIVSIVKELVENSIDADSDEIKIELIEAGLREIKITDNGIGMDSNDAKMAFLRHATSKIYSDDDLFNINSLGFRGEALPSIAAVSSVELRTCHKDSDVGTYIHIKGGKILAEETSVPQALHADAGRGRLRLCSLCHVCERDAFHPFQF